MRAKPSDVLVIGAGAAGLMAAGELAAAGRKVTVLEARARTGGRIMPLPVAEFGYEAEGGAEFVHGEAPLTRALAAAAGLTITSRGGQHWTKRDGRLVRGEVDIPHMAELQERLARLEVDLAIVDFLATHFAGPAYEGLRRPLLRMVEGYDAADPRRASTFALRDEWMGGGERRGGKIVEGYGALIAHMEAECRRRGVAFVFAAEVNAIDASGASPVVRCADGTSYAAAAVIVTVPLPVLRAMAFDPALPASLAAALADIGFGDVIKVLLRFDRRWWLDAGGRDLGKMAFMVSDDEAIPVWWTQYPDEHPVLTGWLAGPRAAVLGPCSPAELVALGLSSLAGAFGTPKDRLLEMTLASRAIHWGADPFARGAYSYATPASRAAQALLAKPVNGAVFLAGEAFYGGQDMGTVEAAVVSGRDAAHAVLGHAGKAKEKAG